VHKFLDLETCQFTGPAAPTIVMTLPPSSPEHALSTCAPGKLVAVVVFFSLGYHVP